MYVRVVLQNAPHGSLSNYVTPHSGVRLQFPDERVPYQNSIMPVVLIYVTTCSVERVEIMASGLSDYDR